MTSSTSSVQAPQPRGLHTTSTSTNATGKYVAPAQVLGGGIAPLDSLTYCKGKSAAVDTAALFLLPTENYLEVVR